MNMTSGHQVAQIRMIFRPIWGDTPPVGDMRLMYAQRFEIIPQLSSSSPNSIRRAGPDPFSGMYSLRRSTRSDGSRVGDVLPLSRIRVPVELVPYFGERADPRLTCFNSLEFSTVFFLNKYSDKELYYTIS